MQRFRLKIGCVCLGGNNKCFGWAEMPDFVRNSPPLEVEPGTLVALFHGLLVARAPQLELLHHEDQCGS